MIEAGVLVDEMELDEGGTSETKGVEGGSPGRPVSKKAKVVNPFQTRSHR